MAEKNKEQINNKNTAMGIGGGVLAGTAALMAGYYFYMSKDAKKHRKIVVDWAMDLKDEVVKEAKSLKKISKAPMMEVIDKVARVYEVTRNIDSAEISNAASELKDNWQKLLGEVKQSAKTAKTDAQKTVRKSLAKKKAK